MRKQEFGGEIRIVFRRALGEVLLYERYGRGLVVKVGRIIAELHGKIFEGVVKLSDLPDNQDIARHGDDLHPPSQQNARDNRGDGYGDCQFDQRESLAAFWAE